MANNPTSNNELFKKWIWVAVVAVGVLFLANLGEGNNANNLSVDDSRLVSNSDMTQFTSVEHSFKIDFPGFPDAQRGDIDVRGTSIPYTSYNKEEKNTGAGYFVAIADYTGIELNTRGSLEGAVNGMVQNVNGQLVDSSFSTFLGIDSIEAHYTAPYNDKNADGYAVIFLSGQKLYSLSTIDVPMQKFLDFVSSFKFA